MSLPRCLEVTRVSTVLGESKEMVPVSTTFGEYCKLGFKGSALDKATWFHDHLTWLNTALRQHIVRLKQSGAIKSYNDLPEAEMDAVRQEVGHAARHIPHNTEWDEAKFIRTLPKRQRRAWKKYRNYTLEQFITSVDETPTPTQPTPLEPTQLPVVAETDEAGASDETIDDNPQSLITLSELRERVDRLVSLLEEQANGWAVVPREEMQERIEEAKAEMEKAFASVEATAGARAKRARRE